MSASDASQQANRAGMDPKRLVVVAYLVFGIIIALFIGHLLEVVLARLAIGNGRPIEGLDWKWSDVAGFIVTGAAVAYCWTNERIRTLALETATELMRVTWPSWHETRVSTTAVVVASLIAAVVLFGIDTVSYKLMVDWLPFLWGKL
jgi:preprotein translocase subunit SecE